MYKAVIFDLDGTLLDTLRDLYEAVNFALREFSFPERTLDEVRAFIGNGVKKLMERSTPHNIDEVTQEKCLECFRKYYLEHMRDYTAPYEGIKELLEILKEKQIRTAVVSNKLHEAVVELSKEYFGSGIENAKGVSDESERKPNPVNVIKVMEDFSLSKDECIYVGDSEVDIMTSHNAGVKCIGVTWGFRSEKELKEAGAEFTVGSPKEILHLIFG